MDYTGHTGSIGTYIMAYSTNITQYAGQGKMTPGLINLLAQYRPSGVQKRRQLKLMDSDHYLENCFLICLQFGVIFYWLSPR